MSVDVVVPELLNPTERATARAIEVEGLIVERGRRRVLDRLTFSVAQGAVVGLLGPSGSGKTTLLRSIVGVQRVKAGTIRVLGEPAGSVNLRQQVGYMTQAPSIYADLSLQENARYFASLYGKDRNEADAAIEEVGLRHIAHRLVGTFSGGERARASLACVLLGRPTILILDEPTVGQDPLLRHELWERFHELATGGATLLVSSHVMDEAGRCDRLLLIREGRLVADDSPDGIRAATGCEDLDEAFLHLVQQGEAVVR